MSRVRWPFGDRLGSHFTDDHGGEFLLVESQRVLARRRFHRAKAQLLLSEMRHRVFELGDRCHHEQLHDRGVVTTRQDLTHWAEGRGGKRLLMEDFYRDARRRHGVLSRGTALGSSPPPALRHRRCSTTTCGTSTGTWARTTAEATRVWALDQLTDWFHRSFVDGYDWVMVSNVVGMSQHADGGVPATKPSPPVGPTGTR